jgi:UDP-N-acetylmuramoyl-tripeptide--D-alanyl-D-alanine ligase
VPRFVLETPWGRADVALELRGEPQAENAAMAAAVALELGVPLDAVVAGLERARTAALRMELRRTPDDVTVINDTYNSSPTSAAAAVRSLARLPVSGRRIAVLGPMLELGDHANDEHAALGALAATSGVDVVVAVGDGAAEIAAGARAEARGGRTEVVTVADAADAARFVVEATRPGDAVLVKASRAVGLESVAGALLRGVSA